MSTFNTLITYSLSPEDMEEVNEGMITNIKGFIREDGEKTMENISKQSSKITEVLKEDGKAVRLCIDQVKSEVRERNNQVKDEIRNKLTNTDKMLEKGRKNIEDLFFVCGVQMNEEFESLREQTAVHHNKRNNFRSDMKGFKKEIANSLDVIKESIKLVSAEI